MTKTKPRFNLTPGYSFKHRPWAIHDCCTLSMWLARQKIRLAQSKTLKGLRPRAVQQALPAPCNPSTSLWTASLVQPKSPDWKLPSATPSTRPYRKCLELLLRRLRRRRLEPVVLLPLLPLLQAEELCLRDHLVGETEYASSSRLHLSLFLSNPDYRMLCYPTLQKARP